MTAAGTAEAARTFIEIGAVVLALAILSRFAGRIGITAVPLYLVAGQVSRGSNFARFTPK